MPRIIHNRFLPFRGFTAINLLGVIFVRHGVELNRQLINHERIHTRQQWELLFLFFYFWYLIEWIVHLLRLRNRMQAYRAISFEREAYQHERDLNYLAHRRFYSFLSYLF